jgi:acyl-CoA thioester hydrolase
MSAEAVFRRRRVVRKGDLDGLGHVNNAVWVGFVVRLAQAHAASLGFDLQRTRALGGHWIVRRHEIDYHASAVEGDALLEETWVARMRGARSLRRARFRRESDGALLLSSTTQWAWVDPVTQRPRRIHPEILAAFTESDGPAEP